MMRVYIFNTTILDTISFIVRIIIDYIRPPLLTVTLSLDQLHNISNTIALSNIHDKNRSIT